MKKERELYNSGSRYQIYINYALKNRYSILYDILFKGYKPI